MVQAFLLYELIFPELARGFLYQNKRRIMRELIEKLEKQQTLSKAEFIELLTEHSQEECGELYSRARRIAKSYYGNQVYMRGLIEFTNYCRNDCYYCGIRKGNCKVSRYHLTLEEIMECCRLGYGLGFRTFVLQGGEDLFYGMEEMVRIISAIRESYPDCAITLSVGERSREEYQAYFDAGANRYLLRHETADEGHYGKLHPPELTGAYRKQCLWNLKEIGYQVGSGFMVGSPWQTMENLADDLLFLKKLEPHMIGIGPFIPHQDTPFRDFSAGTLEMTLFCIGILRLMFPYALLPATTALGTIDPEGREKGILAGANVVMPNLSPLSVRKNYMLYDNKICTGDEAAECRQCLNRRMEKIGYELAVDRGDCKLNITATSKEESEYEQQFK